MSISASSHFLFEIQSLIEDGSYLCSKVLSEPPFCWIDFDELDPEIKAQLSLDKGYSNRAIQKLDLAFFCSKMGIMAPFHGSGWSGFQEAKKQLKRIDSLYFVKKYYGNWWLGVVCFRRPALIWTYLSNLRKLKRRTTVTDFLPYDSLPSFKTSFDLPAFSIVIPTRNREAALAELFSQLDEQVARPKEIIVVDQSDHPLKLPDSVKGVPIKHLAQSAQGPWKARNLGMKEVSSEYVLLLDDDSEIAPEFSLNHLKVLKLLDADVSIGATIPEGLSEIPASYSTFRWSTELDSGNCMMKKSVYEKVGDFDESYDGWRYGDMDYGLRCYRLGVRSVYNPNASRKHRAMTEGGMRSFGYVSPIFSLHWWKPIPERGYLYYYWKNFRKSWRWNLVMREIPRAVLKKYKGGKGILLLPLFYFYHVVLLFPSFYRVKHRSRAYSSGE